MVLISWRAIRAICALMILMCFSRSSIAQGVGTEIVTEPNTVTGTMDTATGITTMMMTATSVSTEAMTTMIMPRPLDPPFNVTAIAINTTSFSVTWNHRGDNRTKFNVTFESNGDDGTISDAVSGVKVTGRRPGELYTVTVTSELNGQEAKSNPSVVRLFPESVVNLTEVTIPPNSSYIQVQWESPDGVVTGYAMECSPGEPLEESLSENDTTGTCINIAAGDNVTVTVTSVASSEEGGVLMEGAPESRVFTAYPNIVKELDILNRTDSSVSVDWVSPDGIFDGYIVECSGSATPLDMILLPSALNATCTNVIAGSKVDVTVSTTSFLKRNPTSILVEALPGKVVDLKEISATTDNVTVSWELPSDHNNETYEYQAVWSDEDEDVECYVAPSNTEAVCANVDPGSLITVTVITVNGSLSNSASTPARAYPSALSDVQLVDLSPNSISVSWGEPEGVVEQYEVSCSEGTPNPPVVNSMDNLTSKCEGLVGGESVTIMITTVSGDKKTNATFSYTAEPNRVVNLREELVRTDFVLVSWERPNGTVTGYKISCEDGGTASLVLDDGSSQYNASCEDLPIPGDTYNITVTPYSSEVNGEGSTIPITAEPAAPNLLSDSSTVDSVSVSFSESEGTVDYYRVECDNGTAKESNIPDGGDLTATCYIDTPGGTYLINVTAVSNGKNSSTVTQQVTALPETVRLTEGDPTVKTVQANWPKPGGIVDSFNIACSPEDIATAVNSTIMFSPSETTYIGQCNVLTPGEEYSMAVTSISSLERSETAEVKLRALPESVALQKGDSTVNSVQASWSMPSGIVDRFEVNCRPGENATAEKPSIKANNSDGNYVAKCIVTRPGDLYTIEVTSNSSGKTSESVSEDLRALPEAVEELFVDEYGTDDVVLAWEVKEACKNGGCVWNEYNVAYWATSEVSDSGTCTAEGTRNTTTIEDLIPGSDYMFKIFVISGDERSSEEETSQRLVPETVQNLTIVEYGTDEVDLSWSIKPTCESRCVWSGYRGNFTRLGGETGNWTAARNESTKTVMSLIPGGHYTFHIFVLSEDEISDGVATSQRLVPEAIENITVDYATDTVILNWTLPVKCKDGGCEWSSFTLSYGVTGQDEIKEMRPLSGNATSDVIGGLTPGESYDFNLNVLSYDQSSEPSNVTQRTQPEAVENFKAPVYTTTTVNLSWTLPDKCNGDGCIWTSFNMSYGITDGGVIMETRPLGPNTRSDMIGNLTPGENYNFTIIVLSYDEYSEAVSVTQRIKPEAVEGFTVLAYTTDTVDLDWTLPAKCNDDGCVWSSFDLSYGVTGQGETMKKALPRDNSSDVIENLTPGESYDFSITVLSDEEYSEAVNVTQRTTPEAVENVNVLDYNTNTVDLSWTLPDKCNNNSCVWSSFNLSYSVTGQNETNETRSLASNTTSDVIVDLTPGESYDFDVTVLSDNQYSERVGVMQRMIPSNVASLTTSVDAENVTVTWDKPAGVVDSYDTSILDDDGVVKGAERVTGTIVSFKNLTAGTNYTIAVCSRSSDQTCMDNTTAKIRTLPTPPSKPRDVKASSPGVNNVTVSFLNSDNPNGYISYYVIDYFGTKEGNSDHSANVTVEVLDSDKENVDVLYSVVVENLRAGHFYTFWVFAHNRRFRSDRSDNATETTNQTEPVISGIAPVSDFTSGRRDIEIIINPNIFRPCNGEILNYTVLVNGEQYIANQTLNSVPNYSSCGNSNDRKRRNADDGDAITLTIGDGSNDGDGYSNGKLKTNTNYSIAIRVVNAMGYDDSAPTYILTGPVHPAAYVVPIVLVILILIFVLVGYVVWKERREPGSVRNNIRKKFYRNGGIDNPGFITDKPMRRTGNSRPVKLSGFALHLEEMSRDSDYLFSEEYNDLRPIGKNQADDAAKLDCNKVKNRFSNILPYDHTRVKLMPNDDEPGSDFINANYMIGHKSNREYIACQGPLQNTEEDMWRMVWEQGASLIVMVTQLMEGNKIKCHQYWPQDGEGPVRYGDIVVLARGTEHNELWVKRLFTLTKGPATREIVHYNFTAWPDHGVPDSPDHLIKFVKAVRESKKYDGKPVVVHCSAGVGRTGTFISLDTLMSQMESSDEVDIFGLVRRMRMNRCLMVQTEIQYIYIHQCVMALLEGTTENTYENYNGNEDPYYNEALI